MCNNLRNTLGKESSELSIFVACEELNYYYFSGALLPFLRPIDLTVVTSEQIGSQ